MYRGKAQYAQVGFTNFTKYDGQALCDFTNNITNSSLTSNTYV